MQQQTMIKTTRPRYKGILPRDSLFAQLDQMREHPVIWISSHAGSGKTTLASSYVEQRRLPCLWYQCDERDADPATFFHYFGQAVPAAASGRRKALPLLTAEYLQGIPAFTLRYFEQLGQRLRRPGLLVFDNYQEVPETAPLHDLLALAFGRIPAGLNALVISRRPPPPAFIRLQANGQLKLLHWEAMRLTGEETRKIVELRCGASVAPEMTGQLHTLCDGWAAGLMLCLETVTRKRSIPDCSDRHLFEGAFRYFMQEIFAHLEPRTQRFLLATAHLPRMTPAMAEALTHDSAAEEILRQMNHDNFFVARHEIPDNGYEYHPLFRNFLLVQARTTLPPAPLAELQRDAAVILEASGQTETAVALLREAGDWEAMAAIVLTHAPTMMRQGRYLSLRQWLDHLPVETMDRNPWLFYWKGMSVVFFSPPQARTLFEGAFARFQAEGERHGALLAASWIIAAIMFSYDDFTAIDQWQAVLATLAAESGPLPDEEIEATVLSSLVLAWGFRDIAHPGAEELERRVLELAETPSTLVLKVHALYTLFWRRLHYKGAPDALPLLRVLQGLASRRDVQPLVVSVRLSAEIKYALSAGRHDALMRAIDSMLELARHTGLQSEAETVWPCLCAVVGALNRQDGAGARDWLERMPPVAHWSPWARSLYHNQSARLALIEGDTRLALAEGRAALALSERVGNGLANADNHLLLAQILAHLGQRPQGLRHLEQARSHARRTHCRFLLSMALLIEAGFVLDEGNDHRGMRLLRQALVLARGSDHVFGMCDHPALVLRLCERALEENIETGHVRAILRRRGLIPQTPPTHLANWPWAIQIHTLGAFVLLRDGQPLVCSRKAQRKPLALLKVLIALGGVDAPEERLAEAIWPDADGDLAHQSLETALYRLRRLLGCPEAIVLREGRLSLNERLCWVDARAFERLLEMADQARREGQADLARRRLEQALGLYRGEFLSGEQGEWWRTALAERLRARQMQGVWRLGQELEAEGQWEQAAGCYSQCLETGSRPEALYRQLMLCLQRLGRTIEALEVYRRCRRTLWATLGTEPSPATEAVRAAILTGQ